MENNEKRTLPFTQLVIEETLAVMQAQDEFGLKKYGKPLDPMMPYDWLHMAQEELADALKYFKAEQVRRDKLFNDIHGHLAFMSTYIRTHYMNTDDKINLQEAINEIRRKLELMTSSPKK